MLSGILHSVTHRHIHMTKDGVGRGVLCSRRFGRARLVFWFQPDFEGAAWHPADAEDFLRDEVFRAQTPHEVMAWIRAHAPEN